PHYDSLVAKLIVHGSDRAEAIARASRALREFVVVGPATTISYHRAIIDSADFRAGNLSTRFIDDHPELVEKAKQLAGDQSPFDVRRTRLAGRSGPFILRDDIIRFPGGAEAGYTVVTNPDSSFVVPYFDNADTMLVRQWRHAWDESSWEVPAGTTDAGEDALKCARRELAEETGLVAARYTLLGVVHGAAFLTGRAHMFLAEGIPTSERNPATY